MKKISIVTILVLMLAETFGNAQGWDSNGAQPRPSTNAAALRAVTFVGANGANGNGGTFDSPKATITAALAVTSPGGLIKVNPGTYQGGMFATNNANFWFEPGAELLDSRTTNYTAVWGGASSARTNYIFGEGVFRYQYTDVGRQYDSFTPGFVNMGNTNSVLYFHGKSVVITNFWDGEDDLTSHGGFGFTLGDMKYANIDLSEFTYFADSTTGGTAIEWNGGEADIDIDSLVTSNAFALSCSDLSGGARRETGLHYDGKLIDERGLGNAIWQYGNSPINTGTNGMPLRWWINVLEIKSRFAAAVRNDLGGGPKTYVTFQKMSSSCSNVAVIDIAGGTSNLNTNWYWFKGQKITDGGGGGFYRTFKSGGALTSSSNTSYSCTFNIDHWEELCTNSVANLTGAPVTGLSIHAGTHVFNGGRMVIPKGRGLNLSGGIVTLNNMTIDTSGTDSATNVCILKTGGTLILNNCVLISGSTAPAIAATNAQNVVVVGQLAVKVAPSVNITIQGDTIGTNTVVVNSALQ